MLEVNISEVVAEVRAAFDRYNRAVDENDVEVMNEMFWNSPHTVRYGRAENLYGHTEIVAYRTSRKTKIERSYPRTLISTFGRDFAIAWTETRIRGSAAHGRQSQTWIRTDHGWRIVAAHVSNIEAS